MSLLTSDEEVAMNAILAQAEYRLKLVLGTHAAHLLPEAYKRLELTVKKAVDCIIRIERKLDDCE